MEVLFLNNDGRCRWLEKKVLNKLIPAMVASARTEGAKRMYLIEDWVSNDGGKVGADLGWLRSLGVPLVASIDALPPGNDYAVVNTGYDSIVHEERSLAARGVELVDAPCPYIRRIREILESASDAYQYVLLCEPNHIIVKNYRSLFPDDLLLVQLANFEGRIAAGDAGKPFRLVPYVTFLPSHVERVFGFIRARFPDRANEVFATACMWIDSPSSPIVEINALAAEQLGGIEDALLVTSPGSTNKSLVSLLETLEAKGLNVVTVSSLEDLLAYERAHPDTRVLLVRSPIPSQAERPILDHLRARGSAPASPRVRSGTHPGGRAA